MSAARGNLSDCLRFVHLGYAHLVDDDHRWMIQLLGDQLMCDIPPINHSINQCLLTHAATLKGNCIFSQNAVQDENSIGAKHLTSSLLLLPKWKFSGSSTVTVDPSTMTMAPPVSPATLFSIVTSPPKLRKAMGEEEHKSEKKTLSREALEVCEHFVFH